MYVGTLKITLRIPENHDLKGKRRIIKSICDRVHGKFKVAIAEVDNHDLRQLGTIGIATVSNDARLLEQTLAKIQNYIESFTGEFELVDVKQEVLKS